MWRRLIAGGGSVCLGTCAGQQWLWRRDAETLATDHHRLLAVLGNQEGRDLLRAKGLRIMNETLFEMHGESILGAWKQHETHRKVLIVLLCGVSALVELEMRERRQANSVVSPEVVAGAHVHHDLHRWIDDEFQYAWLLHTPVSWLLFHRALRRWRRALAALETAHE